MGFFKKKPPKASAKDKKRAKEVEAKLRKEGKLAKYKGEFTRANTGGSAYCGKCDVWYDMNDWTQYLAHDHSED